MTANDRERLDDLMAHMTRKPTAWSEIGAAPLTEEDTQAIDRLPVYMRDLTIEREARMDPMNLDLAVNFKGNGYQEDQPWTEDQPQWFILWVWTPDNRQQRYLVDTEGFRYARYMLRLNGEGQ